jgi:transcription elongation factor GreA
MSEKIYLTQEQQDEFKQRLDVLINEAIPKNSQDISDAIKQGDISENAEYEIAKEDQAKLHQEVAKVRGILANSTIIKHSDNKEFIEIGHQITIESIDDGKIEEITLMGYGNGKTTISVDCPLGRALLGRALLQEIVVDAPIGELRYRIKNIQ